MKKKWTGRAVSLLLTGTCILGLAACGDNQEQKGKDSNGKDSSIQESQKEDSRSGSEDGTVQADADAEITYPLQTDVSLSIWCGEQIQYCDEYASWKESPFHSGLQEKTGVEVDWQHISKGASQADSYTLLLLEEELPNIIYYQLPPSKGTELLSDGMIYDLTDYLPRYAPNFWEYINKPENITEKLCVVTEDGRFYMIPQMRESDYNLTWIGPIIRQDWLDECELETPVTLEDWENVLKTFKEKYGACLGFNWTYPSQSGGIASGTGAYGFVNEFVLRVDDNQKVVIPQIMPEWLEMMKVLHRWYEMGLIDPDSLYMDNEAVRAKALRGDIGITFVPMSQATNIVHDAASENNGAHWTGLEYPRTAAGSPTSMIMSEASRTSGNGAVITTSSTEEELIVALEWLDYAWSEEGIMYWNYGEEGVSYTLDADGKPVWTDGVLNDPMGIDYASRRYSGQAGGAFGIQLAGLVESKNDPEVAAAVYKWINNTKAPSHYMPSVALTQDENEIYMEYVNALSTYVGEEGLKFMTGDRDLAEYSAFTEQLYHLKLQEVLDVWQAAYDRFLSNK